MLRAICRILFSSSSLAAGSEYLARLFTVLMEEITSRACMGAPVITGIAAQLLSMIAKQINTVSLI
jgi:hypothetical protein